MTHRIHVAVSGVPGRMACLCARAIAQAPDMNLYAHAWSSPRHAGKCVDGLPEVTGVGPMDSPEGSALLTEAQRTGMLVLDYSTPAAATANALAMAGAGVSFVMGTTGLDRARVEAAVRHAGIPAVAAPNMAVPLVVLGAALRWAAAEFPGALAGLGLTIEESHQATKKDVSGTAKAFLPLFEALGARPPEGEAAITSIREPSQQQALGIPAEHLAGHAWHRYRLSEAAQGLDVELMHRVLGRQVYVAGTLRALRHVAGLRAAWAAEGALGRTGQGVLLSMEDVLREA